jgi:hypothetical protein
MLNVSQLGTGYSLDYPATLAVVRRRAMSAQIVVRLFLLETISKSEEYHLLGYNAV